MKGAIQRIALLLVLALVWPNSSLGNEILVLLSGKHAVFEAIATGVKEAANDQVTVVNTNEAKAVKESLNRLRGRGGVVAVGLRAFEMVREGRYNLPTVYCSYGNAVSEGVKDNILTVDISTPLDCYHDLFNTSLKRVKRIAVLHKQRLEQNALKSMLSGRSVRSFQIGNWKRLEEVTNSAMSWADAVWLPTDPEFTSGALAFIIKQALRKRKPVLTSSPRIIRGGALAGLTREPGAVGRFAVKWLEGDLSSPAKSDYPQTKLVVNKKVSRFLGVSFKK